MYFLISLFYFILFLQVFPGVIFFHCKFSIYYCLNVPLVTENVGIYCSRRHIQSELKYIFFMTNKNATYISSNLNLCAFKDYKKYNFTSYFSQLYFKVEYLQHFLFIFQLNFICNSLAYYCVFSLGILNKKIPLKFFSVIVTFKVED